MRKNLSVLPLLAFSAFIAPLHAIAQTQQQPSAPLQDYYWGGPWHMMWGWGMFPMMLLFFILLFGVVVFFARCMGRMHRLGPSHPLGDPTHSALQILNERFAKGEINQAEYEERRHALRS